MIGKCIHGKRKKCKDFLLENYNPNIALMQHCPVIRQDLAEQQPEKPAAYHAGE